MLPLLSDHYLPLELKGCLGFSALFLTTTVCFLEETNSGGFRMMPLLNCLCFPLSLVGSTHLFFARLPPFLFFFENLVRMRGLNWQCIVKCLC